MQETTHRDGLGRISKWEKDKTSKDAPFGIGTPEILFVQAPSIPVPQEARVVITMDPSLSETPLIYHRGAEFSSRAALSEESTTSEGIKGLIMAQIPPYLWKPVGFEGYYESLGLDNALLSSDPEKEIAQECGSQDNVKVIYDSISDDELKQCKADSNLDLVVLGNSLELFDRPRKFVESVMRLKANLGQSVLFYTPALGEPSHLALLAYMGIDFFDTIPLIHFSRQNVLLTPTSKVQYENVGADWYCTCRFCQEWQAEETEQAEFGHILGHNYLIALQELGLVAHAIKLGSMRELIESRIAAEPRAVNIIRFLDNLHYDIIEEHTPIARKIKLISSSIDSLRRPEVKRFQKRLRERYAKPEYGKVLLLLPCSARKPYSSSQSHQLFMLALKNCKNPMVVHEVIVTSPLGIVPRELELAYPAQHYDIPVTGQWYEEEKEVIRTQLSWLIDNFEYKRIIAHLDPEEVQLVEGLGHIEITGGKNPTSQESLMALTSALNDAVIECDQVKPSERRHQMITTLAKFHFGENAGMAFTEGVEFRGSYPYLKILFKGSQLGMIEASTGLISLTLAGGERLLSAGAYGVEIDEFEMKGDVFAPGVRDADSTIRPNDEVVVFSRKGDDKILKAVGRATMAGSEMIEADAGKAVRVRHFVKQ